MKLLLSTACRERWWSDERCAMWPAEPLARSPSAAAAQCSRFAARQPWVGSHRYRCSCISSFIVGDTLYPHFPHIFEQTPCGNCHILFSRALWRLIDDKIWFSSKLSENRTLDSLSASPIAPRHNVWAKLVLKTPSIYLHISSPFHLETDRLLLGLLITDLSFVFEFSPCYGSIG